MFVFVVLVQEKRMQQATIAAVILIMLILEIKDRDKGTRYKVQGTRYKEGTRRKVNERVKVQGLKGWKFACVTNHLPFVP